MKEEVYGVDKKHANPRAVLLVPEDFFWDPSDELAPFGSDEGDTALAECRGWRKKNPGIPAIECLKWTIEEVAEMKFSEYNEKLLSRDLIQNQIDDSDYDDQQYIFTLDVSVMATGFAQLVDEGTIDPANKPTIGIAIQRQITWSGLHEDWEHSARYISNLVVLKRVLAQA